MAKDVVIRFTGEPADLQRALKQVQSGLGEVEKQSQSMSQKLQAAGGKMQAVGGTLTRSITLPLAAIGGAALKSSIDFDSAMSKIQGLVGLSADEVDGLRDSVLELSGRTAKSPQELADALFTVTSAGLRGSEAMDVLEMSAKASAAGLGETRTIAEALTGAINAYGPEVLSAANATDILVATARAGNFETSQFAGALGKVTPFAKQAGASLEDVGGAVALLTRTNNDANASITQITALMRAFVVPTQEATKVLGEVGLSAEDVRDSIGEQGLVATLQMLDDKLGGNREQLGRLLGSSEAASAAFQILEADADAIAGTFGAVADATGITEEAFGVAANTAGFKMKQALTDVQGALIDIGAAIQPVASAVAQGVGSMASAFGGLPTEVQTTVIALGGLAAAIGPVMSLGGRLVENTGKLIDAYKRWPVAMGGVTAAVGVGVAALIAWSAAKENARQKAAEFSDAMDRDSGALASNTEQLILNRLEQRNQTDDLARAGVSFDDLTAAIEGNDEARAALISKIEAEGEANFGLMETLAELFGNYDRSIKQQENRTKVGADNVAMTEDQTAAALDLAGGLDTETDAAKTAADAVKALTDATDRLIGSNLSAEQAALRVENQHASLTETLRENGATLDIHSEKGRANREAITSTADAAMSHVAALKEQGASTDEVNFFLTAHVERLKETMRQAGLTEDQIAGYIHTLGLTPQNIATVVQLHGTTEAERQLNWVARDRTTRIYATTIGETGTGRRAFHTGGEFHAPRPGGEGLALLRDGERVSTPTEPHAASGPSGLDPNEWGRQAAKAYASELRRLQRAD